MITTCEPLPHIIIPFSDDDTGLPEEPAQNHAVSGGAQSGTTSSDSEVCALHHHVVFLLLLPSLEGAVSLLICPNLTASPTPLPD